MYTRYIKKIIKTKCDNPKDTALGAGANFRDRKIGALCSSLVEVATQQTFSILMPILKGPPVLFPSGSVVLVLRANGEEGYSIRLRVPDGDGGSLTLAMGAA